MNPVSLILWALSVVFALGLGFALGSDHIRHEAIKRGHAEYVLVNNGPETKFVWKESL